MDNLLSAVNDGLVHHIKGALTFNDDRQSAVGSTQVTSTTLQLNVQCVYAATNYTPSPSRHYYTRLIPVSPQPE